MPLSAALKDTKEDKKPCETVPYMRGGKNGRQRAESHSKCENKGMEWFSMKVIVCNMAAEIHWGYKSSRKENTMVPGFIPLKGLLRDIHN